MLKDELMTKKELYKIYEEKFNKLWYNGAKEQMFDWIKSNLTSDNGLIHFPVWQILESLKNSISNSFYYVKNTYSLSVGNINTTNVSNNNTSESYYCKDEYLFYFVKSKLWNEGINMLVDENCNYYISLRSEKDRYSDMFILSGRDSHLYMNYLIDLSIVSNLSIDEVSKKFMELEEKRKNKIETISKNNTNDVKNKNKSNKNHKRSKKVNFKSDNDGDVVYAQTPMSVTFETPIVETLKSDDVIDSIITHDDEKEVLKEF